MNNQPRIPDAKTRKHDVEKRREVWCQYDILNELVDKAIAKGVHSPYYS